MLGRQTYEQLLGFGADWPYQGLATFVWSRKLSNDDIPASLADETVGASALPPAALLDELVGRGVPLFGGLPADVNLEHLDTQSFDSGVVRSNYAVRKSG